MAYTRTQTATTIKNFRYAVRSGACVVASNHLKMLGHAGIGDKTWSRLIKQLRSCKTAPHFRKRSRR